MCDKEREGGVCSEIKKQLEKHGGENSGRSAWLFFFC